LNPSNIPSLKAALIGRLSSLVHTLYGDRAVWRGHEWRIGNVSGEPGASMAIEGRDPTRLGLWHDHNPAAEKRGGDVLDLIVGALGTDFKGAVSWAESFLGNAELPSIPERQKIPKAGNSTGIRVRSGEPLAEADARALRQATAALLRHKRAMAQLYKRGLKLATIRHFHLGLYSYEGKQGSVRNALSYPVLDDEGKARKRYLRSKLDRVTQGGPGGKDWAVGSPGTYWVTPREGRKELFVCEGAKDGWWLWQALQGSPLLDQLCIITSTHGSGMPEAWTSPAFWQGWDKVYLAQDADDAGGALAHRVREIAGRDVYRVRVLEDYGKDWTDYFLSGQTAEDLAALLEAAPVFGMTVDTLHSPTVPSASGMHAVTPVDISRTYVNGHLYILFRALESQSKKVTGSSSKTKHTVQRYRTLVLRSDGVVCSFSYLPVPKGTPRQDRVLALSDGTLLSRPPVVDETRYTFSLPAITRFREATAADKSAMTLTPQELLEGVHDYLKGSAILLQGEDYALLSFVVAASYAQAIFDAVPLVQVVGPRSSTLARTLARLGCNASLITGHASVTTAIRALDRLGGLAVIADLGGIGKRSSEDELNEFIRLLGASTSKDTASTTWPDPTTLQVERLDLYGVKVIVSTTGGDQTFLTPTLKIYANRLPREGMAQLEHRLPSPTDLQELRDNLHIWMMENAGRIDELYRQAVPQRTSPQEKLTAPLRVLADLIDHPSLSGRLQAALALQEQELLEPMSPVQLVYAAVRSLVRQGYQKKLTLKQLMLELHLLDGDNPDKASNPTSSEWREPRWIGRTLRAEKLIDPHAKDERRWLWGEQTRVVTLEPSFVANTLKEFEAQKVAHVQAVRGPLEFCLLRPCDACPYASFCTMRPRKEKRSGR
jgi:hypothetical protein